MSSIPGAKLDELLEDALWVGLRDARPGIDDDDGESAPPSPYAHQHLRARRVFDRFGDEVLHHGVKQRRLAGLPHHLASGAAPICGLTRQMSSADRMAGRKRVRRARRHPCGRQGKPAPHAAP